MTSIDSYSWKSNIFSQVKDYKRQWHPYEKIFQQYNRILENNAILQSQYNNLEKEVYQLRQANIDLEKVSDTCKELVDVKDKLNAANEEIITNLREKGELAREVLRLNHTLTELNECFIQEGLKAHRYQIENEELREQLRLAVLQINEYTQINQVLRDEFQAIQNKTSQLQSEYNHMKATYVDLEQQLETSKRIQQQCEKEVLVNKNNVAEITNHDKELNKKKYQKKPTEKPNKFETSYIFDDDLVIISSADEANCVSQENLVNSRFDSMNVTRDETFQRKRKSSSNSGSSIFSSIIDRIKDGASNNMSDAFNRTPTSCIVALVPRHEKARWDCTDLEVYSLQFQPSGSILATGCSDKMIHLWEISPMGQQQKYGSLRGSHGAIIALDFDNEGHRLLAGCSGEKAYLWSYGEQKVLKDTYTGHQSLIHTCKFISSKKLVTGSADRTIRIWDLNSGHCTQTIFVGSKCHDLVVTDAAGTIISGHFDKKIRIWDPFTNTCRSELQYDASITSLFYHNEKQQVLACYRDDTLKLIDLRQLKTILTFSHDNFTVSNDTHKAVLSPDGHYACVGSHDGSLIVWNAQNKNCESVLKRKHSTMVTSVAWQPDGKYVASCEKHRQVILWSHD